MLRQTFIYLCKMDDPGLVYAHDALIAKKMNRGEGGKQSLPCNGSVSSCKVRRVSFEHNYNTPSHDLLHLCFGHSRGMLVLGQSLPSSDTL